MPNQARVNGGPPLLPTPDETARTRGGNNEATPSPLRTSERRAVQVPLAHLPEGQGEGAAPR